MTTVETQDYEDRFIVLKMDCLNNQLEVLGTFDFEHDALQYMCNEITSNDIYLDKIWFDKCFEECNVISIYKRNWLAKKSLVCRYFVRHF